MHYLLIAPKLFHYPGLFVYSNSLDSLKRQAEYRQGAKIFDLKQPYSHNIENFPNYKVVYQQDKSLRDKLDELDKLRTGC